MGQAGSVEQRNAIRDVISIKPSAASGAQDRDAVAAALRAFCAMFPMEEALAAQASSSSSKDADEANGGAFDVKESKLFHVIHAVLQGATERTEKNSKEDLIELSLTSFKRVILWRELYRLGAKCSMKPFLNCVLLSPTLAKSALQVLLSLTGVCPGSDTSEKTDKWESLNRRNFGESGGYDVLRSLLVDYSNSSATASANVAAVVAATAAREREAVLLLVLELFHAALVTRRHTTDTGTTTQAVGALLNARISLLDLCHHSNKSIQEFAMELVKELFFTIDLEQVHELQESAREYGALLYALSAAVAERKKGFGKNSKSSRNDSSASSEDGEDEQLTPTNSAQTLLKKYIELVEMFTAGNTRSKKAISRIFPVELFIPLENRADLISRHTASSLLKSTRNNRSLPSFTFDFELRSSVDSKRHRGSSFAPGSGKQPGSGSAGAFEKWLQEARTHGEDWKHIIACVQESHERPDLVWRTAMRDELRQALRGEIDKMERLKRAAVMANNSGSAVRWDHEMFYVEYHSIQKELVVNGYFVEYLIPMLADLTNEFEVIEPLVLAWHLSDRLAVEANEAWKILCLRCLRLLIRRYAMVLHGQLPTRHVLELLHDHARYSPIFIRECFLLLNTAIMTTQNAPSESLNQSSVRIATTVVEVLSDSVLISSLSRSQSSRTLKAEVEDLDPAFDFDEEEVHVRNASDGLVRAGVGVLQAIIRRFKYTLQLVRPKRVFICRLLAVETLDHVTIHRILLILKQLAQLDASSASSGTQANGSPHTKPSVDANWKSLALVYILVSSCDPRGRGMSSAAAEFLRENYSIAAPAVVPTPKSPSGSSVSSLDASKDKKPGRSEFKELLNDAVGFDGCGIGSLLSSSDPSFFCEIFNAEEKRSADVWWGRRQRQRLFRYLKRKFVASASSIAASNQAEEMYDAVLVGAAGEHDEGVDDTMDAEIFVGNIFLHSYVDGDGQFLNEWTPEMYQTLISALFTRLMDLSRTRSVFGGAEVQPVTSNRHGAAQPEAWEVQVLILKALVRLLPTDCSTIEMKAEYYETLLLPLRRSLLGETDQIRGSLALELMMALLHVPKEKGSNADSCRQFLTNTGLSTISEALVKMLNPAYQQLLKNGAGAEDSLNMARVLLSRATDLVTTLSVEPDGVLAIQKNPSVLAALLDLSSKQNITLYSAEAAATSLLCLARLCQHDELLAAIVGAGVQLIDVCVFCPVGAGLVEPASAPRQPVDAEETNNHHSSDEEEEKQRAMLVSIPPVAAAVRAAAFALQACLCDSEGNESPSSAQVLKQLLTPSFVRILRLAPVRFVRRVQSKDDISSSTLIWTATMRKRLADTLSMELAKVKTAARSNVWPRWNPDHFVAADSFRYQYPELADELIVHDVYINKFVSSDGVSLEDIDMSALSQALLISIQSGENVLRILQQRGASDPAKERSIVVMRLALNKLVTMHPQHNLQVDRTPPTSIGMTSLIENESSDDESDSDDDTSTAGSITSSGFRTHGNDTLFERSSTLDDLTV